MNDKKIIGRHTLAILTALCTLIVAAAPLGAHAQNQEVESLTLRYEGELVDEENAPISGVFPMTFRFYAAEASERPVWSERQYVSVRFGEYEVYLGSNAPISPQYAGRDVFLAVEIDTIGEIQRVPYSVEPEVLEASGALIGQEGERITFADIADRALYSERARHAESCDSLNGVTLEELQNDGSLEDQLQELRREVQDLRNEMSGGSGGLGSRTVTLEKVGGDGGRDFRRACPPGHVVVGINGAEGQVVDSVALICAPIE